MNVLPIPVNKAYSGSKCGSRKNISDSKNEARLKIIILKNKCFKRIQF